MVAVRGTGEVFWGAIPRTFIVIGVVLAVLLGGAAQGFADVSIDITAPQNTTIADTTPDLNFTTNATANVTYNWDGNDNMSGCRNCTSYNTVYGEYANSSEQNLSAVWHFNENFGDTAFDDSGSNDALLGNGTAGQKPSWTAGRFGRGLNFDGTDDYVNIPYASSLDVLDGNKPFTFGMWFKVDRLPSVASSNYALFSQANGGGSGKSWLTMASASGAGYAANEPYSYIGGTVVGSNVVVTVDTWYFFALTYNGTHSTIYINGSEGDTAAVTADENANGEYHVGVNKGASAAWFNGTIDEVMLFDRGLSAAEIQDIYNKTLQETQHNVTVYANDGTTTSTTRWFNVNTTNWLNVSLLYPNAENKNVVQNGTFWVNATVRCEGAGSCGIVNGTVRYNSTGEPDKIVNDSSGAKPFYVVGGQTPTCGTLDAGETCRLNWTVNATGNVGSLYVMDVNLSSSTGLSNNTGNAEKNTTVATEYTRTLYVTNDWNWIAWPYAETPIEEALANITGLYESVWYRNGSLSNGDNSWCWYKEGIGSKAGCDFYTLKPGREYQINITAETNFTMSGALQSVNLTLVNTYSLSKWRESFGWLYQSTTIYTAVASIEGSYKSIWYWNDQENKWYGAYRQSWSPYNSQLESYGYGILTTLEPGKGYGFWATNEDTLELSPP